MNNWQEWVVGVLIVLCIARVIYGIYLFFRRTRESENPCDSCVSGCDLKDMMEKKRQECGVKKKSTKQNRVRRFESARNLIKPFQMISERVFLFS